MSARTSFPMRLAAGCNRCAGLNAPKAIVTSNFGTADNSWPSSVPTPLGRSIA